MYKKIACLLLVVCVVSMLAACADVGEIDPTPIPTNSTSTEEPYVDMLALIQDPVLQYPAANDYFYYNVYDGFVAITKYLGDNMLVFDGENSAPPSEVVIPDMLDGLPVYEIGPSAFKGASFAKLTISKNVIAIGEDGFSGCKNLKEIIFTDVKETAPGVINGKGLVSVGGSAFSGCVRLEAFELSDTIESMGTGIFHNCESLISMRIPDTMVYIPADFCSGCVSLANVYIPDTVVEMAGSSFSNVADDVYIHGGVYSCAALYAARNFMFFIINTKDA